MKNGKLIHDSVHGTLQLDEWMVRIADTPQFQRLRRIKQLGFADLVYPGAHHTRFEHSIGSMHVARRLSSDETVLAASLLHDIGHTPFSHSGERIIQKYLRKEHEDVEHIIKNSTIHDILQDMGLNVKKVVRAVKEPPVSSVIDVDRIDYLLRDSHHTGVAYGVVDFDRLIRKIRFDGEKVYVEQRGVRAVESFLISRYMMYSAVYNHHVCRIAKKMFEKAMESLIEKGEIEAKDLLKMDDYDAISVLRSSEGYPREIAQRLDGRRLFKRAIYAGRDEVEINIERIDAENAEKEIAEMAGVEDESVIVDIPGEESSEYTVPVLVDDEYIPMERISPLVSSLKQVQISSWRLGVYCPREHIDKVRKASLDYFGIRISKQKRLNELFEL